MKKQNHPLSTRLTALLLTLICVLGLFPTTVFAAADAIKLKNFGMSGVAYQSAALGKCSLHQMYYENGTKTTVGFCGTKGGGMGDSLKGQTWGKQQEITDMTVKVMMAYYYAHSTGVFTDAAKAAGVDDVWGPGYTWYMNAWVQACIWRYQQGSMSDPVTACAEELMAVYNSLEGTHYTSIDEELDGRSFRDRTQFILDGGINMWGDCKVYEYKFTGAGSSHHPASSVQKVILGELTPTTTTSDKYSLIVKKVDSSNPSKGLPGAVFHVQSENGSFSKDVTTGADGTYTIKDLDPGTYAVTETAPPPGGYKIDNAGPQYVVLPSNGNNTVTVTFTDTPEITGEGSIRKVDADDPTKGLAGAIIKITGVDNNFSGTFMTREGGYITDIPWDTLPIGSFVAEEVTPPENYSLSPDPAKVKQTFVWDGKTDVSLVFENDASNGEIRVSNLAPGALILTEVKAPAGYVMDAPSTNIMIGPNGDTQTVIVTNTPKGGLVVEKYDKITKQPLAGARFKIVYSNGELLPDNEGLTSSNGLYTTDQNGQIVISKVLPGTLVVTEDKAPDFYQKDPTPQTVVVNAADTQTLRFYNDPLCTLTILKRDAVTHKPLSGGQFLVQYSDGHVVGPNNGLYTTGADGTVTVSGLRPNATVMVSEQKAPNGYAYGRGEKYSLELGNDLSKALTSELAMLASPKTMPLFLQKYQRKQIKQYQRREPIYKGMGDIICCLDESDSTKGDPAAWGKAVALTLLEIAADGGRNFALVHFSRRGRCQTDLFRPGVYSVADKMSAAEVFLGGGTNFETPMWESLRLMREEGFENADIVFITDGQCEIPEHFLAELRQEQAERRFTITGVLLDSSRPGMDFSLKEFCQNIYRTSQLASEDIVRELVGKRV